MGRRQEAVKALVSRVKEAAVSAAGGTRRGRDQGETCYIFGDPNKMCVNDSLTIGAANSCEAGASLHF